MLANPHLLRLPKGRPLLMQSLQPYHLLSRIRSSASRGPSCVFDMLDCAEGQKTSSSMPSFIFLLEDLHATFAEGALSTNIDVGFFSVALLGSTTFVCNLSCNANNYILEGV